MQEIIHDAFTHPENFINDFALKDKLVLAVSQVLADLDAGKVRAAEKKNGKWLVNQYVKQAILLSFKLNPNKLGDFSENKYYDKVPLKFANWSEDDFADHGFRVVAGAVVRHSAFIDKKCIIMPSFINFGAYVGEGTMIDTWATVGSCAQVGKNCHISGGVGLGGVLEPVQSSPTIIEDNVFIGARSEVVEGVVIGEGAVLSMGVFIGASTRIYLRDKDEVVYGEVPPYSVVVPGVLPSSDGKTSTAAAIVIKQVDEKTRAKTSINELLRS
jgi:2,3,4,5-tetrahydropyridine-2-carboxylate N-succinyltransferase